MADTDIDTTNSQLVGSNADHVVVLMPKGRMTKAEALRHAAWLVLLADDNDEFDSVLAACRNT